MSIDHNHIKDGIWHDFVPNMFELVQYHLSKWHGIVLSNQDRMLTIAYMRDKKTVNFKYWFDILNGKKIRMIILIFDFENQILGDFDPTYSSHCKPNQIVPKVRC